MLNVYELYVFLVAAETQNFSEAARQLHLSQPAVSQQIQSLERHLGVQLFQRAGRNISLTEAGQVLVPLAREMTYLSKRIEETMRSLEGKVIGRLRIGCSTTAGKYILPHLVARFRECYPEVQVTVEVSSQRAVIQKLAEGQVHLCITSTRVPHKDLLYRDFFTDHIVLIVPRSHPWAARGRIQSKELLSANFIMREEISGTRQVMLEGLEKHGISLDQINVVMELGNAEAIEMAVEEGIGIAFVSRLAAQRGLELGRIKEVEVEGLDLCRPLYMACHARRSGTAAQLKFWEFVHEPENQMLLNLARRTLKFPPLYSKL